MTSDYSQGAEFEGGGDGFYEDFDYDQEEEEVGGGNQWSETWDDSAVSSTGARGYHASRANYSGATPSSTAVSDPKAVAVEYNDSDLMDDGFVPLRPTQVAAASSSAASGRRRVAAPRGRIGHRPQPAASGGAVAASRTGDKGAAAALGSLGGGLMADAALAAASAQLGISATDVANVRKLMQSEMAAIQSSASMFSLAYYKYYFHVDNTYVLRKLSRLCLPFLTNDVSKWRRVSAGENGTQAVDSSTIRSLDPEQRGDERWVGGRFAAAATDVNAPDAYIPLMAMATYVAAMGLATGTRQAHAFSPQILIQAASSACGMLLLEALLTRGGFWLIQAATCELRPSYLDCFCYAGYKLVFVALNLVLFALLHSDLCYYSLSIVCGLLAALFTVQTLRPYFLETDLAVASQLLPAMGSLKSTKPMDESSKMKHVFLLLAAVIQIVFIQLMGRFVSL